MQGSFAASVSTDHSIMRLRDRRIFSLAGVAVIDIFRRPALLLMSPNNFDPKSLP